jgi:hypothetical protein
MVGDAEVVLEMALALAYVNERVQYSRPIGGF